MATPDQKSPNVLLQNLCCRILGKSEGSGAGPGGSGPGATPGRAGLRGAAARGGGGGRARAAESPLPAWAPECSREDCPRPRVHLLGSRGRADTPAPVWVHIGGPARVTCPWLRGG